jgi:hypothetical protein
LKYQKVILSAILSVALLAPLSFVARTRGVAVPAPAPAADARFAALRQAAPQLNPRALQAGLAALDKLEHTGAKVRSDVLGIIDYSLPSTERRFWVFDLKSDSLLFHELVAHGKNSGGNIATHFSNADGSLMSSLGVFITGNTYIGEHGLSLRLQGVDKGENDNCLKRAIVIHAANYVSEALAQKMGRIGRSWGCPAVRPEISKQLIQTLEGGAVLLAYYPGASAASVSAA